MYTCFSDINLRLLENRISLTDKSLLTTEEQNRTTEQINSKKKKT